MAIFSGSYIGNYFKQFYSKIERKIQEYDYRQLKDFSDADINSLIEYFKIQNIDVDFDSASVEVKNDNDKVYNYNSQVFDDEPEYINAKGKRFIFHALIFGDWSLLKYSLGEQGFEMINYYDSNYDDMDISLNAKIGQQGISFNIFIADFELKNKSKEEIAAIIRNKKETYLHTTKLKIARLNRFIDAYNGELPKSIKKIISTKIEDDSSLELVSDVIGVEVHSKVNSKDKGTKIEILPKKADLTLPDRKKYNGYYLDKSNYSAIISTIRNHLSATEDNPRGIEKLHDEELIRDTILWSLNSNYFVATGESFRASGKTDILINFNDKSVFIAECKIWKGRKYIEEGIDQLLSYTTWRDSKMALVIFNINNADFSQICEETKIAVTENKNYKRMLSHNEQNYFECELIDKNNEESVITLSVMLANYVVRS